MLEEPTDPAPHQQTYTLRELHYLKHTMQVMLERHPDSSLCPHRRHMLAYYEHELDRITHVNSNIPTGSS
ncbi:hypothetical protein [Nocardioides ultimimeridianus]